MKFLILLVVLGLITMGNCVAIPEPYAYAATSAAATSADATSAAAKSAEVTSSAAKSAETSSGNNSGEFPCDALDPTWTYDASLITAQFLPFVKP